MTVLAMARIAMINPIQEYLEHMEFCSIMAMTAEILADDLYLAHTRNEDSFEESCQVGLEERPYYGMEDEYTILAMAFAEAEDRYLQARGELLERAGLPNGYSYWTPTDDGDEG